MQDNLQFLNKLLKVALGSLLGHDLEHLLADGASLAGLSIASRLSLLVVLLLSETNAEHTEVVTISGADINKGLNKGLPLADKRAELVAGHVHAVEVGDAVSSLNVLAHELDLSVSLSLIATVEVSKAHLEHTSLERLGSDL